MPVGEQTVGGVPFRIVDPAKNNGHGLVVLHSPMAPQEIKWPKQVEIPVGAKGRRLFFLGNVHGWAAQDGGTGPWGAVAQYVIHYADGQKQIVPLITGRTADDWAMPPDADEAFVGLKGDPWHLNVLGVQLRPVEVQKIVFEDLGTPAAPVLVAVTLEKQE
jgi:beta-galactosidase